MMKWPGFCRLCVRQASPTRKTSNFGRPIWI